MRGRDTRRRPRQCHSRVERDPALKRSRRGKLRACRLRRREESGVAVDNLNRDSRPFSVCHSMSSTSAKKIEMAVTANAPPQDVAVSCVKGTPTFRQLDLPSKDRTL